MLDFETREWAAYGLIAALVVGVIASWVAYRRRRFWRKLRLSGSARAKRRELGKR